jgi:hypothetical protein
MERINSVLKNVNFWDLPTLFKDLAPSAEVENEVLILEDGLILEPCLIAMGVSSTLTGLTINIFNKTQQVYYTPEPVNLLTICTGNILYTSRHFSFFQRKGDKLSIKLKNNHATNTYSFALSFPYLPLETTDEILKYYPVFVPASGTMEADGTDKKSVKFRGKSLCLGVMANEISYLEYGGLFYNFFSKKENKNMFTYDLNLISTCIQGASWFIMGFQKYFEDELVFSIKNNSDLSRTYDLVLLFGVEY